VTESDQNILKVSIHSFPAWRSVLQRDNVGKFAWCVLEQGT